MTKLKFTTLGIINITLAALLVISNFYGMSHFSDGGCDGGTCGVLLFFYSIPLVISWLFTIVAVNKSINKKGIFILFLLLGIGFNPILLLMGYWDELSELKNPGYLLVIIHILTLVVYFTDLIKIEKDTTA